MPDLPAEKVQAGFNQPGLMVMNSKETLQNWLENRSFKQANLVLMSSGNYDGLDMLTFAKRITGNSNS